MTIRKRGNKYEVTTQTGRVLGTHDTRKKAVDQLRAVEANKSRTTRKSK